MAIKLGNTGKYSGRSGNYYPASMRFRDGLLEGRNNVSMANQQSSFINNMQKDPGLTLATSIGGLLGSIVGNTVNENGIRKGTETAMSMLDNMKQDGKLNPDVEQNGFISMDNAGAKGLLSGTVSVNTPAPGVGVMQGYMDKYATDPNPIQSQSDANRATDFIKQGGNNLYANATPDEIRNMIRRQAMAEGRSSQQIDRIMANVDPEITAGYNKYMDEKDAANYAAALGYIKDGRFNDAMELVPNINNPNLVKALGVANDYAMQEKNLQLKRDALMMKAMGRGNGSGAATGTSDNGRIIETYAPKYREYWSRLPKTGTLDFKMDTDINGNDILASDVFKDKNNYERGLINLNDTNRYNQELNDQFEIISNAFNGKYPKAGKGFEDTVNDQYYKLLRESDPLFAKELQTKLYNAGYLENIGETLDHAYKRRTDAATSAKQLERNQVQESLTKQEREKTARDRAFNYYLRNNHPELTSTYFNGVSPYARPLTDEQKTAAQKWVEENYNNFLPN